MLNYLRTRKYKFHFIRLFIIFLLLYGLYAVFGMVCWVAGLVDFAEVLAQEADVASMTGILKVFYYVTMVAGGVFWAFLAYYWLLFTCWMIKKSYLDQKYLVAGPLLALFLNFIGFFIYCFLPSPKKKE